MSLKTLRNVVKDHGSKYAVSGGPCESSEQAQALLADLKRDKKFAKAKHNTWGLLLDVDGMPDPVNVPSLTFALTSAVCHCSSRGRCCVN